MMSTINTMTALNSNLSEQDFNDLFRQALLQNKELSAILSRIRDESYSIQQLQLVFKDLDHQALLKKIIETQEAPDVKSDIKYQCVDVLLVYGAKLDFAIASHILVAEIQYLSPRGYDKDKALVEILSSFNVGFYVKHYGEEKCHYEVDTTKFQLLKSAVTYLVEQGASLSTLEQSPGMTLISDYPVEFKEYLLSHGLSANTLLRAALSSALFGDLGYYEQQALEIKYAVQHGADVNLVCSEHTFSVISQEVALILLDNGLSADVLLYAAIRMFEFVRGIKYQDVSMLVDLALQRGASALYAHEDETILEMALTLGNIELLDKILKASPQTHFDVLLYAALSVNFDLHYLMQIHDRFPDNFVEEKLYDVLRGRGVSHIDSRIIVDTQKLAQDLLAHQQGKKVDFSEPELSILESASNEQCSFLNPYQHTITHNYYGFTLLHIAILTHQLDLVNNMLDSGFASITTSTRWVNAIQWIYMGGLFYDPDYSQEADQLFNHLLITVRNNINIFEAHGESILDIFLDKPEFLTQLVDYSNDPLFLFMKCNVQLQLPADKIHIGISYADGFWSTGINSAARLITMNHPDVHFHLVTRSILDSGGEQFIQQFSGWINPGAGDSYPRHKKEFTKSEWKKELSIEQIYQYMLGKTLEFNIPYFGMCAGAQHLALYHGGSIAPVKGYGNGQHIVTYKQGTIGHFYAMTEAQQRHALKTCEFQHITFKGDTAHHYAAVVGKVGDNLELGAVSEHGIPMSYAHQNGIRVATQFHPEHYYKVSDGKTDVEHQEALLETFVRMAQMRYNYMHNNGTAPTEYMSQVKAQLDKCVIDEMCSYDEHLNLTTLPLI